LTSRPGPGGLFFGSGAGGGPPWGGCVIPPLSGGTRPPPKFATSVNVWSLPPSFLTLTVSSRSILRYAGSNRHAECPITALESGEARNALNSASVTSPSSSVQPPTDAQLGSLGSQSSRIEICRCATLSSRLCDLLCSRTFPAS